MDTLFFKIIAVLLFPVVIAAMVIVCGFNIAIYMIGMLWSFIMMISGINSWKDWATTGTVGQIGYEVLQEAQLVPKAFQWSYELWQIYAKLWED
jgi:hypothetical protein